MRQLPVVAVLAILLSVQLPADVVGQQCGGCVYDSPNACNGVPDGDYQSCESCEFYVSCKDYQTWLRRPCPISETTGRLTQWLIVSKTQGYCTDVSTTCNQCGPPTETPTVAPLPTNQPTVSPPVCSSTGPQCITASPSSCKYLADGDYQACEGCTFYHSCSGNVMWSNRPCPLTNQGGLHGKLVWVQVNARQGFCDYQSSTCKECSNQQTPVPPVCASTGPSCISATSSCVGRPDGNYQACESCTMFHSCSGGVLWANRDCPITHYGGLRGKLVWQQLSTSQGICDYSSTTCHECADSNTTPHPATPTPAPGPICLSTGAGCITGAASSCKNRPDGHYQACEACTIYHSCSGGVMWANRQCPLTNQGGLRGQLVWRQMTTNEGICDYASSTCHECYNVPTQSTPWCNATGPGCITASPSSCQNRADGDYQACEGCTIYHSCSGGVNWANRQCPLTNQGGLNGRLVWVQLAANEGICEYESSTCRECPGTPVQPEPTTCHTTSTGANCITGSQSSCLNRADGDYQACESCTIYHSCSGGVMWPNRDCPVTNYGGLRGRLVWQQFSASQGICDYSSTSCHECDQSNTPAPPGSVTTLPPASVCVSTGAGCITGAASSCHGRADGHYQACEACTIYHSCSGGVMWPNRQCPLTNQGGIRGHLVWKQLTITEGICDYVSNTCHECEDVVPSTPAPISCVGTGASCITASPSSCQNRADGDYQACEGCTIYHSCSGGVNWANRQCPLTNQGGLNGRLVWVQLTGNQGICDYHSATCKECPSTPVQPEPTTCHTTSTGANCITGSQSSCLNRADGDYQACESCTIYHSCSGGVMWSNRDCPVTNYGGLRGRLVWQQFSASQGICDYSSTSCHECNQEVEPPVTPLPIQPCHSTGSSCITAASTSCKYLADGHYQACEGCTIYHSCSGGVIWSNRQCPLTNQGGLHGHLVWKQLTTTEGICDYVSNTCHECDEVQPTSPPVWSPCEYTGSGCITGFVSSCKGLADGDYQACEGCTIYHSCSGGVMYASRSCPVTNQGGLHGRLVWKQLKQNEGVCEYSSNTCTECVQQGPTSQPPIDPCVPGFQCLPDTPTACRDRNLPDGDYQACPSCNHYLSCRNGETWQARPCPVIDGVLSQWVITSPGQGYCSKVSGTCNQCDIKTRRLSSKVDTSRWLRRLMGEVRTAKCDSGSASGTRCITGDSSSCEQLVDGDYQACEGCTFYHSCSGTVISPNRPCPFDGEQTYWHSLSFGSGVCVRASATCQECPAKHRSH